MVKYTSILINSIETKSTCLSWFISQTRDDLISVASLTYIKSIYDLVDLDNNQSIEIYIGSSSPATTIHFKGYIEKIEKKGAIVDLVCLDKFSETDRGEVTEVYDRSISETGGRIDLIFQDILENNTNLLASATSTTTTIKKFICNHHPVKERLEKLRKILDWQMYYNPTTDRAVFEPKGNTSYSTTLEVGVNCHRVGNWKSISTGMVNNLTIIGGYQTFNKTETFTGNGTQTDFQLIYTPFQSIKSTVNSVVQKGGIDDISSDVDYTIDTNPSEKKVKFKTAPVNGLAISIEYSYQVPIIVTGK